MLRCISHTIYVYSSTTRTLSTLKTSTQSPWPTSCLFVFVSRNTPDALCQMLRVAVFHVREAQSADIMQYYPMFLPSPVFMSTIVAHFNRICRHRHIPPPFPLRFASYARLLCRVTPSAQNRTARAPLFFCSSDSSPPAVRRRSGVAALAGAPPPRPAPFQPFDRQDVVF